MPKKTSYLAPEERIGISYGENQGEWRLLWNQMYIHALTILFLRNH